MKFFLLLRALPMMAAVSSVLLLTGCIVPKVYVDPQFRAPETSEIATVARQPVRLVVTGLTNQKPNKRATKAWTKEVTAAVERSKVFATSEAADAAVLEIQIDNVADVKDAMAKGFVTGMTFGLSGSVVTDRYIMTATYKQNGATVFSGDYKHALHTVVGAEDAPIEGVKPTPLREVPARLVEDLFMNFERDFQNKTTVPVASAR